MAGTSACYYSSIITAYGQAGWVVDNTNRYGNHGGGYGANLMPGYYNYVTGQPDVSHVTCTGIQNGMAATETMGQLMNVLLCTRGYGALVGDILNLPMSGDPRYAGTKFLDPSGELTPYCILGGTGNNMRILVPR